MGLNCLKARATSRRQFTFYHQVLRNSSTPLKKITPLFPSNRLFKTEILSSPSLFENLVGGVTLSHPAESKGCTLCLTLKFFVSRECQFHSLFHCVLFWLGITTDSKIISEFCEAIYQVPSKKYLSSLESPEEWKTIAQ